MNAGSAQLDSPMGPGQLKSMIGRLGLPVLGIWVLGGTIAAFSQSTTVRVIMLTIPAVLTLLAIAAQINVVDELTRRANVTERQMNHRALGARFVRDGSKDLGQVDLLEGGQGLLRVVLHLELGLAEDRSRIVLLVGRVELGERRLAVLR